MEIILWNRINSSSCFFACVNQLNYFIVRKRLLHNYYRAKSVLGFWPSINSTIIVLAKNMKGEALFNLTASFPPWPPAHQSIGSSPSRTVRTSLRFCSQLHLRLHQQRGLLRPSSSDPRPTWQPGWQQQCLLQSLQTSKSYPHSLLAVGL